MSNDRRIIYRTDSFNGNGVHDIVPMLVQESKVQSVPAIMYSISHLASQLNMSELIEISKIALNNELDHKLMTKDENLFRMYLEDVFKEIKTNFGVWLTTKQFAMSRSEGFGRNMHKDNGLLKCTSEYFVLIKSYPNQLVISKEKPKLVPDLIVNTKLATKDMIEELIRYEEEAGKILAETSMRGVVKNALKLVRMNIGSNQPQDTIDQWDPLV